LQIEAKPQQDRIRLTGFPWQDRWITHTENTEQVFFF